MKNLKELKFSLTKYKWIYKIYLLSDRSLGSSLRKASIISTGLPRCGNTLLSRKLRICYIEHPQLSHNHSIAHLKFLIDEKIPFLFCCRDPKEFIPSWHLKSGISVDLLIQYTYDYYKILETCDRFMAVLFEKIVSDETYYLEEIGRFFNVDVNGVTQSNVDLANDSIKKDNRGSLIATYPNKEKDAAKRVLKDKYRDQLDEVSVRIKDKWAKFM